MTGSEWEARFAGGWLTSWTAFEAELLDRPPQLELWRAPTDNDRLGLWVPAAAKEWADHGLHRLQHRSVPWRPGSTDGHVEVAVTTRVAPAVLAWGVRCTYRYIFDAAGRLAIVVEGEVEGDAPSTFGRVGLAMACPSERSRKWLVRPGARTRPTPTRWRPAGRAGTGPRSTSWRRLTSCLRRTATAASRVGAVLRRPPGDPGGGAPCSVSAPTAGRRAALAAAAHRDELVPEPRTWLHFDHRQHGLGSAACGPGPLEPIRAEKRAFPFLGRPVAGFTSGSGPGAGGPGAEGLWAGSSPR